MFIDVQDTPNPDALRFLPGRSVSPDGPREYRTIDEADASPLAESLFQQEGVVGVLFGSDHVTVTRAADGPAWSAMKTGVVTAIMDHFASGAPLVRDGEAGGDSLEARHVASDDDSQIVREIKDLLDTRIRPAVAQDGGDILFDRFDEEDGVLWLRMRGACSGCPSSSATLKAGVESMMRHYVPEVLRVEQVF